LIALRTFDEKPCGPSFNTRRCLHQSFLGYSLKRHSRPLFLQSQVTPGPARTHAACVSLSLSTMSISRRGHKPSKTQTNRRKNLPDPPLRISSSPRQLVGFRHERPAAPQRRAPSVTRLIWPPVANCQATEIKNFRILTSD
jgi:hypothetical protein